MNNLVHPSSEIHLTSQLFHEECQGPPFDNVLPQTYIDLVAREFVSVSLWDHPSSVAFYNYLGVLYLLRKTTNLSDTGNECFPS